MKKLTNKLNLPGPLYKAICNDSYDAGISDYTVTELLKPARMAALAEQYSDQLVEDASDRIYSLQGQSIHTILERAAKDLNDKRYVIETRFYMEIDGKLVSAQIDILDLEECLLQDYKITSVYKVKDGVTEEYAQQTNVQKFLIKNGYYHPRDEHGKEILNIKLKVNDAKINKMEIVAILRDWSKGKYRADVKKWGSRANYPSEQVVVLDVPIIDDSEILTFLKDRIKAHDTARSGPLPECSDTERWAVDRVFAVMKKGVDTARRLLKTRQEAEAWISSAKEQKDLRIEERPAENKRCDSFCPVKDFCSQYKEMKKLEEGGE